MAGEAEDRSFFVTGGTLKPDAPCYVERPADQELWERLQAGDYCYVLTAQQMGKSSLMARTAAKLRAGGEAVATVDLTTLGSEKGVTVEEWFYSFLRTVHRDAGLKGSLKTWWQESAGLTPAKRFTDCLLEVMLAGMAGRLVIFVDEIDSTLGLPFTSTFFAAGRACYNARAMGPDFRRLSFVLLGVATPNQLISDSTHTLFNIGHQIDLKDFTIEVAHRLAVGFNLKDHEVEMAHSSIKRILYCTNGQPFLTQTLCRLATENNITPEAIDKLTENTYLRPGALKENIHLKHISDRVLSKPSIIERLRAYKRILTGEAIYDDATSPIHASLKLSGIVTTTGEGVLRMRSRIYECTFNMEWIRASTSREERPEWLYMLLSIVLGILMSIIASYFFF